MRHSIISKIQIRKFISITFQSCDVTSQSSPTVQGNNLLVTSSLEIALPILALKGGSLHSQIYEDYLIWNKISENGSCPSRKVAHISYFPSTV